MVAVFRFRVVLGGFLLDGHPSTAVDRLAFVVVAEELGHRDAGATPAFSTFP